jgi:hypothetical protein
MKTVLAYAGAIFALAIIPVACFAADAVAPAAQAVAAAPIDWWRLVQTYLLTPAAISGLCGFLAAILPQGSSGVWGILRSLIDFVAMNWGNAKNAPQA